MKRELMESAGLEIYAEIGIVIFVVVFILIIIRVVLMKRRDAEEMGEIPLEDDISKDERVQSPPANAGHNKEA